MRYIKVLLLVIIFFISMLFLFQNQETLSRDMLLQMNLFYLPPMKPVPLPTYFVLLAGFLLGALSAVGLLLWDKLAMSAKLMKANWRVRSLEKELARYMVKKDMASQPAAKGKSVALPAAKGDKLDKNNKAKDDINAPDPDKGV